MPPAARVTDMHTCPMVTGVVPHVGGPILPPGCPTVLIGFLPAARIGDTVTCVGPPDTIVKGSPTVLIDNMPAARMGDNTAHGGVIVLGHTKTLIGDAGSGGGGGGGGGAVPGAGASSTLPAAVMDPIAASVAPVPVEQTGPLVPAEEDDEPTWIGVRLEDFTGQPMPNQQFQVTLEGGQVLSGTTDADGHARFDGIDPDQGEVAFPEIPERAEAAAGDEEQQPAPAGDAAAGPDAGAGEDDDVDFSTVTQEP